ncbi:MAG: sigma-54-dependent Fis family transcriptional regulator [Gracilimonas sp.]|uniref:sigma-54-dependent transcriptional regulator n=1 Tax=Gracilimonas sp. TaxID=1974203 RepID=UPI001B2E1281|nr:sigma-54 dependent transcriptional regulator [Gracilimonas sp.]MBO6586812.1 sigma-54-dependent Fis family transcriptional regulator [Gracilimonas sp.]MBO6614700.1 sigma-54-dependent Fis family transcriptional regulator [Gracilimonas sp.]
MKHSILVVDDDELLLGFMEEILTKEGFKVHAFESPVKATEYLEKNSVDLVITDVKMNEMTGDEVLANVKKNYPDTGVIMITGFGNINHAVRALHKGAFDYMTKPFKAKEILYRVNRYFNADPEERDKKPKSVAHSPREDKKGDLVSPVDNSDETENKFIGNDPQIKKLMRIIPQIARNTAPVLIQGESGTGKEVFAHQIHVNSNRAQGPYIKINCANLPSELVESTLFGHLEGSFTGATSDRQGAFDAAEGGTLLLDEITEIKLNVQAKLLRVLQENEFYRVGSQEPVKADVRILATSNRNIAEAISEKQFREDLYYRLNVFPVEIPPLRDRKTDIPVLANYFVEHYSTKYGLEKKELSEELLNHLVQQEWRGNVRELNNKIHRGIILAQDSDKITMEHINHEMFSSVDDNLNKEVLATDLPLMSIEDMELQLIQKALEHTQGNQKKAAKLLGISDRTIRNKLKNLEEDED